MRTFWKNHSIKGLEKYLLEAIENKVRFSHFHVLQPEVKQINTHKPTPDLFSEGADPSVIPQKTNSNIPKGHKNQIIANIGLVRPDLKNAEDEEMEDAEAINDKENDSLSANKSELMNAANS